MHGPQVTFAGNAAVGSGPVSTRPRVGAVDEATTAVEPTTTESSTLKFCFLIVNVAGPVETLMIAPPSLARFAPPKSPEPPVSVTEVVPPADRLGTTPQTLTHLPFPLGHRPRTRNCPALAPVRPRLVAAVRPSESASGMPMQNGALLRLSPPTPPSQRFLNSQGHVDGGLALDDKHGAGKEGEQGGDLAAGAQPRRGMLTLHGVRSRVGTFVKR